MLKKQKQIFTVITAFFALGFGSLNAKAQDRETLEQWKAEHAQELATSQEKTPDEIKLDSFKSFEAALESMDRAMDSQGVSPEQRVDFYLDALSKDGSLSETELTFVKSIIDRYGYAEVWRILKSDLKIMRWMRFNDQFHWKEQAENNRSNIQWEPANTALELAIRCENQIVLGGIAILKEMRK